MNLRARILAALAALVVTLALFPATAAGADPVSDSAYISRLYTTFLMRTPDSSETTYWVTALQSGMPRTDLVATILNQPEFREIWTDGIYFQYLHRLPGDEEVAASQAQIGAGNGNFVTTEVTVLGGAEYFAAHGSTNAGFVTALYNDVVFRAPDAGGQSYWLGQLNAGASRSSVVATFVRLSEVAQKRTGGAGDGVPCAATSIDMPNGIHSGSYCLVLRRPADTSGYQYWSAQLAGQGQLPTLWAQLAGTQEFYNLAP